MVIKGSRVVHVGDLVLEPFARDPRNNPKGYAVWRIRTANWGLWKGPNLQGLGVLFKTASDGMRLRYRLRCTGGYRGSHPRRVAGWFGWGYDMYLPENMPQGLPKRFLENVARQMATHIIRRRKRH